MRMTSLKLNVLGVEFELRSRLRIFDGLASGLPFIISKVMSNLAYDASAAETSVETPVESAHGWVTHKAVKDALDILGKAAFAPTPSGYRNENPEMLPYQILNQIEDARQIRGFNARDLDAAVARTIKDLRKAWAKRADDEQAAESKIAYAEKRDGAPIDDTPETDVSGFGATPLD